MRKLWVTLIAVVSFAAGIAGSSLYWMNFNAQFTRYGLVSQTEADIVTKEAVLEHLRDGRVPDSIKYLETLLDGDLVKAAFLARHGTEFDANTYRAVETEFKARAASGYLPSDLKVRKAVHEAFILLRAKSDRSNTPIPPS